MIVSVNGTLTDGSTAISAADRSFLLGDGVFETVLIRRGAPIFLSAHVERLRRGLAALIIPEPAALSEVKDGIRTVAARNDCGAGDASARITVSRGAGPRGLKPPSEARPTLVISVEPQLPLPAAPLRLILTRRRRLAASSFAEFKATGGYLENMLARADAAAAGADDGLLCNEFGRLVSASAANLFVLDAEGALRTPSATEGALPGITRAIVLEEAARLGLGVSEEPLTEAALQACEIFLTNSLIGIRRAVLSGAPDHPPSDIFRKLEVCYARRIDAAAGSGA